MTARSQTTPSLELAAENTTPRLRPRGRVLLGPGPSNVHPAVSQALGKPMIGHLDPQFLRIMDEVQDMLRRVFLTDNELTIAVSGTGSAGMEAVLVNLIEPGDEVLVCVNGVFGERMSDIVGRVGGVLHRLDRPWGEVFEPAEIAAKLDRHPAVALVAIVHAETSTGAHQPLEDLGAVCHERDALLMVDAVTSLGGTELRIDDWSIDACYSGTQKCLSCPPGLAPVTLGPRAVQKLEHRVTKVISWYLDFSMIQSYWSEGKRAYHHTAPISMNYALHKALALVLEEGLECRWQRHQLHSQALMAGLEALDFEPFADRGHRLPMLNSVRLPVGLEDASVRRELLQNYDIEIGGGLGELAGLVWRIGLMGESARQNNVLGLLTALEEILFRTGHQPRIGRGLEAAAAVYRRD
jgi:alanine-glyoxylate transaminase/serine-glyoxylate transaminase/serine-pyruvate transaminase